MNYTNEEFINYKINDPEIQDFCFNLINDILNEKSEKNLLKKDLENSNEQLYFCQEFIKLVLHECNKNQPKENLINIIKNTFENSYIEL